MTLNFDDKSGTVEKANEIVDLFDRGELECNHRTQDYIVEVLRELIELAEEQ